MKLGVPRGKPADAFVDWGSRPEAAPPPTAAPSWPRLTARRLPRPLALLQMSVGKISSRISKLKPIEAKAIRSDKRSYLTAHDKRLRNIPATRYC